MINIALRAAQDAADAIAHSSDRLDRVKIIDDTPTGFLTSMDQTSDKTILYHLEKAFPTHKKSFPPHKKTFPTREKALTDKKTIASGTNAADSA